MATEFDYHSFPDEITAEALDSKHNTEIFEILTQSFNGSFASAEAKVGYLADRRDYFDFDPIGEADPAQHKSDDLMIQFSIRMNRREAEEHGLIAFETQILSENAQKRAEQLAANAERLQFEAAKAQAIADGAKAAAEEARKAL